MQSNPSRVFNFVSLFFVVVIIAFVFSHSFYNSDAQKRSWINSNRDCVQQCRQSKAKQKKERQTFSLLYSNTETISLFTWTRLYSRHKNRLGFITSPLLSIRSFNMPIKMSVFDFTRSLSLYFISFVNVVCIFSFAS